MSLADSVAIVKNLVLSLLSVLDVKLLLLRKMILVDDQCLELQGAVNGGHIWNYYADAMISERPVLLLFQRYETNINLDGCKANWIEFIRCLSGH